MNQQPSLPPGEQERLKTQLEGAAKFAAETNLRVVQVSLDIAKEKTQYFEKIALACAGTIALMVSFVGARAGRLHPAWLLRSALITLVLAMMAAMYRNWKYPFYLLALHRGQELAAQQRKERCRRDYISAVRPLALENGKPIDVEQWLVGFNKDDGLFDETIAECKKQTESSLNIVIRVEKVTLILVVAGMIMLIALAWGNF